MSEVFGLSWNTFRERWQLHLGAILSVAVGVALMESSLLVAASAAAAPIPAGLSPLQRSELHDRYDNAATVMGITTMLSVFLAVFIVSSTFAFTVAQRRRDLALLRLVGGSRGQLYRLLTGEALLLAVCGVAIGIPLGVPAVGIQTWLLNRVQFLPAGFVTDWVTWVPVTSGLTGMAVGLLGVLVASRRAARVRPLEALRDDGSAAKVMTPSRWFFGLTLLLCSVALLVTAPFAGLVIALALSLGLAVAGGVALSLLSPLAVPLTSRLFGLVLRRSVLGGLAEANLRSAARRSGATAAPLIVLVALLLGLAGTLNSVSVAASEQQQQSVTGDLVVQTTGANADRVAAVPGVAVASPEVTVPATFTMTVINTDDGRPMVRNYDSGIVAVEPAAFARTHHLRPIAGNLDNLTGATIAVTQASEYRLTMGQQVSADFDGRRQTLKLTAILPELLSTSEQILLPKALVPASLIADAPAQVIVQVAANTTPTAVADAIRAAGIGGVTTVSAWAAGEAAQQQDTNVATLVVLMGLSGLYAMMAVINAVVIAGADRKREFATVRVTGLTRRQVIRLSLVESWAVTLIGLLLGALVVAGTLAGIATATRRTVGHAVVEIPWQLGTYVGIAAFVTIGVTSILTTLMATKPQPVTLVTARE